MRDPNGLRVIEALAPQVSRYAVAFLDRPEFDYSRSAYSYLMARFLGMYRLPDGSYTNQIPYGHSVDR